MNAKELKRYTTEIIFGGVFLCLLGLIYWVTMTYLEFDQKKSQLYELEESLRTTQSQIQKIQPITQEDKLLWEKVRGAFLNIYPFKTEHPKWIDYNSVTIYEGDAIPLNLDKAYRAIYDTGLKLTISRMRLTFTPEKANAAPKAATPAKPGEKAPETAKDDAKKAAEAAETQKILETYLSHQRLTLEFAADYKSLMEFIAALRKLPMVLILDGMQISSKEIQGVRTLEVKMELRYFYRKVENPFADWKL